MIIFYDKSDLDEKNPIILDNITKVFKNLALRVAHPFLISK